MRLGKMIREVIDAKETDTDAAYETGTGWNLFCQYGGCLRYGCESGNVQLRDSAADEGFGRPGHFHGEKSCNCAGGATGCCFGDGFARWNPSIAKLLSQGYGEDAPAHMPAFMKAGERFFCTEEVAQVLEIPCRIQIKPIRASYLRP